MLKSAFWVDKKDGNGQAKGCGRRHSPTSRIREVKTYIEVRPIFHYRPDRVRNHVRLCFLAYWISARLGKEWRQFNECGEVPRILRSLQKIRVGFFMAKGAPVCAALTQIPKPLNALLAKIKLRHLFASPPTWAAP